MVTLGTQAVASLNAAPRFEGDLASQGLMIESAKAAYQAAKLRREAAEIALREWEEGNFKQQKAFAVEEIKLAQGERKSAEARVAPAKERYPKITQMLKSSPQEPRSSAVDLATKWAFEWDVFPRNFGCAKPVRARTGPVEVKCTAGI